MNREFSVSALIGHLCVNIYIYLDQCDLVVVTSGMPWSFLDERNVSEVYDSVKKKKQLTRYSSIADDVGVWITFSYKLSTGFYWTELSKSRKSEENDF